MEIINLSVRIAKSAREWWINKAAENGFLYGGQGKISSLMEAIAEEKYFIITAEQYHAVKKVIDAFEKDDQKSA